MAYLFERILKDKQCVGETSEPTARLFAQFHALPPPQKNKKNKKNKLHEERHHIRDKERSLKGEGAIYNISICHEGCCSICDQHH